MSPSSVLRRIRLAVQGALTRWLVLVWSPALRYLDGVVIPPLQARFDSGVGEVLDAVDVLAEASSRAEVSQVRACVLEALSRLGVRPGRVSPELVSLFPGVDWQSDDRVEVRTSTSAIRGVEVRFPGRGDSIPRGEHWAVISEGMGRYTSVLRTGTSTKGVVATVHIVQG